MGDQTVIRPTKPGELPFLWEMLFEAAYWRLGQERPSLETGLARSDLAYLLADWGRSGDTAVVANTHRGDLLGAAWYRFWDETQHSYGYLAPKNPELGIAVVPVFRGRGMGRQLLSALLTQAARQGIERVSLRVEVDNPAQHLISSYFST